MWSIVSTVAERLRRSRVDKEPKLAARRKSMEALMTTVLLLWIELGERDFKSWSVIVRVCLVAGGR